MSFITPRSQALGGYRAVCCAQVFISALFFAPTFHHFPLAPAFGWWAALPHKSRHTATVRLVPNIAPSIGAYSTEPHSVLITIQRGLPPIGFFLKFQCVSVCVCVCVCVSV